MSDRLPIDETLSYIISVNDNKTIDRWIVELLLERGGTIVRANSTEHALFLLQNLYLVDGLITNLRRRESGYQNNKAGIELAASIRRLGYNTPIILYSANLDAATKKAAFAAGVNQITVIPSELRQWIITHT